MAHGARNGTLVPGPSRDDIAPGSLKVCSVNSDPRLTLPETAKDPNDLWQPEERSRRGRIRCAGAGPPALVLFLGLPGVESCLQIPADAVASRLRRRPLRDFDATLGFPGEGHARRRARRSAVHLAFWNACTLHEAYAVRADGALAARGDIGKMDMLLGALSARQVYACGIAEHRLRGTAVEAMQGGWHFLRNCTGAPSGDGYRGGVGLLLCPEAARRWREHGSVVNLEYQWAVSADLPLPDGTLVSAVAFRWPPLRPGGGAAEAEAQRRRTEAIREVHNLLVGLPAGRPVLLSGDANGCPGAESLAGVAGGLGQGPLTAGGEELLEFAAEHDLRLMGTYFPKAAGRGLTWWHPGTKEGYCLDHVMVRARDARWVTDVEPKALAECCSDHRLVLYAVNTRRGRGAHARRGKRASASAAAARVRHDTAKLRDDGVRAAFEDAVADGVANLQPVSAGNQSLDAAERELTAALRSAADAVLGPRASRRRLGWKAEHAGEIRAMAEARRELAARDDLTAPQQAAARREMRAEQQAELRRLAAAWWDRQLEQLHGGRGLPSLRAVEQLERGAGLAREPKRSGSELLGRDGKPLCGHDARLARWREHFASLFAEESKVDLDYIRAAVPRRETLSQFDAAPTRAEYAEAVRSLKKNKAAGADGVVAELLQAGGEAFHDLFFDLVAVCWERGEVPAAWRDALMVPLPKPKGDLRLCDSWRGISLLAVPGKILACIVARRVTQIAEGVLGESANGFRAGRGTMDCVALARALLHHVNASADRTLHCVFVDLRKAFDKVHRAGLWTVLERQGVPPRLLAVLRALHDGMLAQVRVDGSLSDSFPVRTGVRQGCLVAPALLNLFYAAVLDEWRRQAPADITITFSVDGDLQRCRKRQLKRGEQMAIGDTVYADDTSLFASSWESMQRRWFRYTDVVGRFGLVIAHTKTKVLTAGRDDSGGWPLAADARRQAELGPWLRLEGVDRFNLLGSIVQSDGHLDAEIAARLRSAGAAWRRLRQTCFSGSLLAPQRRYRLFSVFVLTRLLYGAELWYNLPAPLLHRVEQFYNRCVRAICGHTRWTMWQGHISDNTLRRRCGAPELLELLDRGVLRWVGHCARMSATRTSFRLMSARVAEWPPRTSGNSVVKDPRGGRIGDAARRFGIDRQVLFHAAQDAER
eukprot:gene7430-44_t